MLFPAGGRTTGRMNTTHRALALFSGGLDSILAAKLIQEQGIEVLCLHFVSPFFGYPEKIAWWERTYGLTVRSVDIGEEFIEMLRRRPAHGFGSVLNPCVDCKILMLRKAKELVEETGACCVVSGEVLGQRPMSQRRDTLNVIQREADLKGLLLRPLCARHMDPTNAENAGIIDRDKLLGFSGRGRKAQLALAARMGLKELPTPAGGCRLAEQENARSYHPVLQYVPECGADDFRLAHAGRQLWSLSPLPEKASGEAPAPAETSDAPLWLIIGRKQADNDALMALARPRDVLLKVRDFPGPIGLCRYTGRDWSDEDIRNAAALAASYSPKAVRFFAEKGLPLPVRVHYGSLDAPEGLVAVSPLRDAGGVWREYTWVEARAAIKAEAGAGFERKFP